MCFYLKVSKKVNSLKYTIKIFFLLFASPTFITKINIFDCQNRFVTVVSLQWRCLWEGIQFHSYSDTEYTSICVSKKGLCYLFRGNWVLVLPQCHLVFRIKASNLTGASFVSRHISRQEVDSNLSRVVESWKLSLPFTAHTLLLECVLRKLSWHLTCDKYLPLRNFRQNRTGKDSMVLDTAMSSRFCYPPPLIYLGSEVSWVCMPAGQLSSGFRKEFVFYTGSLWLSLSPLLETNSTLYKQGRINHSEVNCHDLT
jgi:hypothetical protein